MLLLIYVFSKLKLLKRLTMLQYILNELVILSAKFEVLESLHYKTCINSDGF